MDGGWKFSGFVLYAQPPDSIEVAGVRPYNGVKMPTTSGRATFGAFELDLESGALRKSGRVRTLRPQPSRVLCLLVSQAGRTVSRDEIRRLLWDDATFVDYDTGVDYCVHRIRSVLGDDAQAPRYVETLPRRGYRFIAPVRLERAFAEPTVAVLPFANLNRDPEMDYFADGVADALITELARIPAVRVISRQSVLHLKGTDLRLDEIARDLGVNGVARGSSRSRVGAAGPDGSRAPRVGAQL
jgi:DNA-binding winged helix-turn-helix (wHTH) protein